MQRRMGDGVEQAVSVDSIGKCGVGEMIEDCGKRSSSREDVLGGGSEGGVPSLSVEGGLDPGLVVRRLVDRFGESSEDAAILRYMSEAAASIVDAQRKKEGLLTSDGKRIAGFHINYSETRYVWMVCYNKAEGRRRERKSRHFRPREKSRDALQDAFNEALAFRDECRHRGWLPLQAVHVDGTIALDSGVPYSTGNCYRDAYSDRLLEEEEDLLSREAELRLSNSVSSARNTSNSTFPVLLERLLLKEDDSDAEDNGDDHGEKVMMMTGTTTTAIPPPPSSSSSATYCNDNTSFFCSFPSSIRNQSGESNTLTNSLFDASNHKLPPYPQTMSSVTKSMPMSSLQDGGGDGTCCSDSDQQQKEELKSNAGNQSVNKVSDDAVDCCGTNHHLVPAPNNDTTANDTLEKMAKPPPLFAAKSMPTKNVTPHHSAPLKALTRKRKIGRQHLLSGGESGANVWLDPTTIAEFADALIGAHAAERMEPNVSTTIPSDVVITYHAPARAFLTHTIEKEHRVPRQIFHIGAPTPHAVQDAFIAAVDASYGSSVSAVMSADEVVDLAKVSAMQEDDIANSVAAVQLDVKRRRFSSARSSSASVQGGICCSSSSSSSVGTTLANNNNSTATGEVMANNNSNTQADKTISPYDLVCLANRTIDERRKHEGLLRRGGDRVPGFQIHYSDKCTAFVVHWQEAGNPCGRRSRYFMIKTKNEDGVRRALNEAIEFRNARRQERRITPISNLSTSFCAASGCPTTTLETSNYTAADGSSNNADSIIAASSSTANSAILAPTDSTDDTKSDFDRRAEQLIQLDRQQKNFTPRVGRLALLWDKRNGSFIVSPVGSNDRTLFTVVVLKNSTDALERAFAQTLKLRDSHEKDNGLFCSAASSNRNSEQIQMGAPKIPTDGNVKRENSTATKDSSLLPENEDAGTAIY